MPRLLDSLHLSMAFASVWIYLIQNWGNDDIYDYIPWLVKISLPNWNMLSHPVHFLGRLPYVPASFLLDFSSHSLGSLP